MRRSERRSRCRRRRSERLGLVDARETAQEAVARNAEVQPPNSKPFGTDERDRLVAAFVESTPPVSQSLDVVAGEALHVFDDEPGALERGDHTREVQRRG